MVLFPAKIFQFPEKIARHCSTEKKGDKEANKPIKEKERKRKRKMRKTRIY